MTVKRVRMTIEDLGDPSRSGPGHAKEESQTLAHADFYAPTALKSRDAKMKRPLNGFGLLKVNAP
jgi:hypothetical protein